jgi:hypothetical protein
MQSYFENTEAITNFYNNRFEEITGFKFNFFETKELFIHFLTRFRSLFLENLELMQNYQNFRTLWKYFSIERFYSEKIFNTCNIFENYLPQFHSQPSENLIGEPGSKSDFLKQKGGMQQENIYTNLHFLQTQMMITSFLFQQKHILQKSET